MATIKLANDFKLKIIINYDEKCKFYYAKLDLSRICFHYRSILVHPVSGEYLKEFYNWVVLVKNKLINNEYFEDNFKNFGITLNDKGIFVHIYFDYKITDNHLRLVADDKDKLINFLCEIEQIINSSNINTTIQTPNSLILCSVSFGSSWRRYYYLTEDNLIEQGARVVVPVGINNQEKIALVRKVEYYPQDKLPYPIEKIKNIIRKIDFDLCNYEDSADVHIKLKDGFECIANTFEVESDVEFEDVGIWVEVVKVINNGGHQGDNDFFKELDILQIHR